MYENEIYGSDTNVGSAGKFSGAPEPVHVSSTAQAAQDGFQTNTQTSAQTGFQANAQTSAQTGFQTNAQFYGQTNAWEYTKPGSGASSAQETSEKEKKPSKGMGIFQKAILSVSLGLLFGIFAGLGFYAVQQGTGLLESGSDTVITGGAEDHGGGTGNTAGTDAKGTVQNITYTTSDISSVVEEVMPAMVSIINYYTEETNFWGRTYYEDYEASGSGIIVAQNDSELLIVTNHHVVSDANELEVAFIDGETATAKIKGMDSDMDLAVIAVDLDDLSQDTVSAINVATLGDSDNLKLGEPVIAIGNALGYGQSVTNGIVSALDREVELSDGSTGRFIQTNAAINPGNSGGALLNIRGEVIGINSNKYGAIEVEGMGYAIPITAASPIIADLMERQTRSKVDEDEVGYIGIEYEPVTDQIAEMYNMPKGVFVRAVKEDSAAEKAGIMKGDIITKFEGEKILDETDLQDVLQYYAAGDKAKITVMRPEKGEYKAYEVEITLGRRPSESN